MSDRFGTFYSQDTCRCFVDLFTNYTIVYPVRNHISTNDIEVYEISAMQGIYIKMGLCSMEAGDSVGADVSGAATCAACCCRMCSVWGTA